MLLVKMNIIFFNTGMKVSNITGYGSDIVTSSTFKFDQELYYIGFFQPLENIEEYKFQKCYLMDVKFPSIDYDTYRKYELKWKINPKLEICMGKRIIGTGELINWEFAPIA